MKTRRWLAFVLCLAMLFSDATSTLASTMPGESVVVSDDSEQIEVLNTEETTTEESGSEVPEEDVTSTEEVTSTETTAVVVPEKEPEAITDVVKPTEVVEDTEEIVIEVVEDFKAASATSLTVGYTDENEEWVEIGTNPYTSFTDVLTEINTFLEDPYTGAFSKTIQINMEADATLDCELDLGSDDVPLTLNMNGYTLDVAENRSIRANVWTANDQSAGTIAVGAGVTLSILPFDPLGYGMSDDEDWEIEEGQTDVEYTNWQNVIINFDSTNKGDLVIGHVEDNGESATANIRLNDVYINHAKNLTIEGNVGIDGIEVDPSTIQLDVAETITVNNKGDNAYVDHYVEILVPTTCENLVWYTSGAVADLMVRDTITADTESDLNVNGQFTVNNVYVEEYWDDPWGNFGMATHHLYQADGTLISAGAITINGEVNGDETLDVPLNFRKHKWAYASADAEWPDHLGVFAYTEGEVVATAPNVERQLVSLNDAETGIRLFPDRNEEGQLVAEKTVIEVSYWNEETYEFEKWLSYTSLEDAIEGMKSEFGEAEGQYVISIYDDIMLNADIEIPDFATQLRIETLWQDVDVEDEEGNYAYTYYETTLVNLDFNGHTISVNGPVNWSEAVAMTNSSEEEAQLYFRGEAGGFEMQVAFNAAVEEYVYVNGAGEIIARPEGEYTWIDGVDINMPNGSVYLGLNNGDDYYQSEDITRILNTNIIAEYLDIQSGTWEIRDITLVESEYGSHVGEAAALTVTGVLTAPGRSHFEVRGKVQLGDIVLVPHSEDSNANLYFEIDKVYGPENEEQLSYMGDLVFTGSLTTEDGFTGIPLGIGKKNIIVTYVRDENGDIEYDDEEQLYPRTEETHEWENLSYETEEVLATITESSTIDASMFAIANGLMGIVSDGSLKVGESSVRVHLYIPEEDRGYERGYESLEDAFVNMQADFDGREGEYTITLLENTILTEDIEVPGFVSRIRFESVCEWIEHCDENGEPIWIYDEEGNEIGIEGHDRIIALTFDMNGHSITANCDVEWSEVIQITNSSDEESEIHITAGGNPEEGYWPSFKGNWFNQDIELVDADGNEFSFGDEYVFIDNVTIRVPEGRAEFETVAEGTHVVNSELIVSSFKCFNGKWDLADVTITMAWDGSFIGEEAEVIINGKTSWMGGTGVEVRGTLTFADILLNVNPEDPYANMWTEIAEMFDRTAEGTDEYYVGKGTLTFGGTIEAAEGFEGDKVIHINKKEVYYYHATDEEGNLLWENEEEGIPMIWEDQYWDLPFESGETVAYVTDSSVSANLFNVNGSGISLEIIGEELKTYKSAVYVDLYIEEEDRGIGYGYRTLEEAFANLERDFEGREGSYTVTILENVELSEDIVLPDFVRNFRMQTEWEWIEHCDEYGNPIEIYDEEGNFMGTEGHHDVHVATLDLNGYSITSAGNFEVIEGLQVVSDAVNRGEIISTIQDGGVSIRQADNVGALILATGDVLEVSIDKPFVILDNVDIIAEKGGVGLWSLWGAYTVNGNITARTLNVAGNWNVEDVKITTDLYIQSGWYDEAEDYGEPDGYLTANNMSIYNGHMCNEGRLVVKDTFTAKRSGIENFGTLMADKLLVPSGEFHNFEQVSVGDAEIEWFYNHTDVMYFEDDPETEENEEHVEEWGAIFICDTFKQSDKAFSYMDGSTEFIVNVEAVINNLCTGGFNQEAWNPVNITRMQGANLQINEDIYSNDGRNIPVCIGIFNKLNDEVAGMGMVEVFDRDPETGEIWGSWFELAFVDKAGEIVKESGENGWHTYRGALERGEVLFTTDISNVPSDLIGINQYVEEGKEEEAIWGISQDGNKVVVGDYPIYVYSIINGDWKLLRGFVEWTDAVTYIDNLSNPNVTYAIELNDDISIDGSLTLPKNVLEVVICGMGEDKIEVTCTGEISLASIATFDNIELNASNSTVKMNGFNLIFVNSNASIGSAVGTKESILAAFSNSHLLVRKAATGLAGLEVMWGSTIELGMDNTADVSVAKKLQLYSGTLVIHDSLTVEEVASWDDLNTVVIKDSNSFTITGTVYGPDVTWDESCKLYVGDKGVTADNNIVDVTSEQAKAKIRISAINIEELALNSNFAEGEVLVNAPYVSEAWFVSGSVYNEDFTARTKIGSLTHKEDGKICYGAGDTTLKPVELRIHDDAMGDFVPYDTYATLTEAFAEIDRIGNVDGFYRIVLTDDVEIATMTTPSKAQALQIWVEDEQPKTIAYGGDMKLNCRLIIANAILAPQSEKSKIDVGSYAINLIYGTKFTDGYKIASITGSGVTKGSEINLHDTEITVSGDVKNIAVLCLQNAVMTVEGAVNVGDVICFEDYEIPENRRLESTLIGMAKVTRTDGKVTKVDPQITFAGDTWYEQSEMHIALQEKLADGSYKLLDFTTAEMTDVLAAGIPLAKAPKISSMMLLASKENKAGSYITAKDNGYVVVRKDVNAVGVILTYEYPFVRMEWNDEIRDYEYFDDVKIIETYCETVADAVTEINNWNTARAYEIILLSQNANMTPVSLKMPNKKAIESLTIKAQTGVTDLRYTGAITFTSDVVVENVNFVQVTKAGEAYKETDTPAAVSVSTDGNELTLNGKVTFNTPIKLDGKKKGTLNINGTLTTITYYDQYGICGSITNFAEVNIRNTNENPETKRNQIVLGDYGSTAPTFSATVLNMDDYTELIFYTSNMNAKLNVTDLSVNNGLVYVEGTVAIKNLEMNGETELDAFRKMDLTNVTLNGTPRIRGYREFTISGTVISNTGNSVLHSAQKSASNRAPYLDIKGDVILANDDCKIGVVVDDYMDVDLPKLENSPSAAGMLLTAKKASADMFVPATVTIGNKQQNNIDNAKPYSEDKENGYVLMKSGNSIYVYYGKDIAVKLADEIGNELGYYGSIADAVKAIDAIKDKDATYIIELLKGYGNTTDTAAELKMPKFASGLMVMSDHKMYFNGTVALSAATALVVAGDAEFAADVAGKGVLALGSNMTLTVKGKVDTTNLVLNGGSVLDTKGVVNIGTITNNGNAQNAIHYGKDAKDITYLTIKGLVSGENSNTVLLQMSSETDMASYALSSDQGKVILENKQKIANIEKAALSCFEISINNEKLTTLAQAVKANKGVYHVAIDTDPDWLGTWLEYTKDGKAYTTYCLDFAQAVNEINTLADKSTDYTINICRKNTTIWDVNLTDTKTVSAITMPKANVANSVTIAYSGFNNWQRGIEFTGNISYSGNLGFVNCEIEAANISGVKTLTLDNTAFVTTGTVKADNVVIKGNTTWDAFGKTTVGGLDATEKGNSSYIASKPDAKGAPTFTVNGVVPVVTVWKVLKANATTDTAEANRYVDAYTDVSLVVAKAAGADRFMAYPFVTGGNNEGITNLVAYKDTKNAVKNGNGDDMKVLLSYEGGATYVKSYDEAVKLIDAIGDKNGFYTIQFLTDGEVTTTGADGSYGNLKLPKKAFCVEIVGNSVENGKATTTLKYTGTMKTSVNLIIRDLELTEGAANGNVFTPSYAVTPATSGKNTEINFVGAVSTMKKDNEQTADLAFTSVSGNGVIVIHGKNVDVAGSVASNIFVMNNAGTISVEKDVKVTELVIAENATIEAKGKFTAKAVHVLDVVEEDLSAVIDADGVIALTDIFAEEPLRVITNRTAKNESQLTISGNVLGNWVDVAMNVLDSDTREYREMTMEDAVALLVTEEHVVPVNTQKIATAPKASAAIYVLTYETVDEDGNKDWVDFYGLPNENPEEEPEWIATYKHDGGIYITNLPTLLDVYSYSEDSEYYASFMDWEQAVKEIDKLGNKDAYYEICVQRPVGKDLDGTLNPIKNLTLPAKAMAVGVYGGDIYFTGTKITPKTATEFVDIGLYAVKAVKEDDMTFYESVTYDVNVGNNMVAFANVYRYSDDGYENKPGVISGSKKAYLSFYNEVENGANEIVATTIKGVGTVEFMNWNEDDEDIWGNYLVTKGMSGVQNLIMQPRTFLGAYEGDISVKDVHADRADIYAKNINVSGTIEMSQTGLSAGTETVGDGAIKIKDVILNSKCGIYGKQDKNGKSLIQITGKVSTGVEYEGDTEGLLQIGLFYNNDSDWVPLSDNLVLLTAPKADDYWFEPIYSWEEYEQAIDEETGEPLWDEYGNPIFVQVVDEETGELLYDEYGNPIYVVSRVVERMGWRNEDYGVYKSGKTICYGRLGQ